MRWRFPIGCELPEHTFRPRGGIAGRTLADVIAPIVAVEQFVFGRRGRKHRFRAEDDRCVSHPLGRSPASSVTFTCASRAKIVLSKNNLVALYPREGYVIKIFSDVDRLNAYLDGARVGHATLQWIQVPKISHHSPTPYPHLVEEYVAATRPSHAEIASHAHRLLDDLKVMHAHDGAQERISFTATQLGQVHDLCTSVGVDVPWIVDEFRTEGLAVTVDVGRIHGDITRSNLFLSDGNFVLTDWEASTVGQVGHDSSSLVRSCRATETAQTRGGLVSETFSANDLRNAGIAELRMLVDRPKSQAHFTAKGRPEKFVEEVRALADSVDAIPHV